MVDFKKILHQVSSFGPRPKGLYKYSIYRVVKTLVTAADRARGKGAIFIEESTEISGIIFPFMSKRWGNQVTDNFADLVLVTNSKLTYDESDDTANDEISYNGVRYRIVSTRHHDLLLNDDRFDYALVRKLSQAGGP